MTRKTRIVTLSFVIAIVATGHAVRAGDLNPPAGPIAPTQRTTVNANMTPGDADSLFKITQPGSYYLTGNIQGVAAKHGIEIAASGVTLDLNGFDLLGVAGSLDGVSVTVVGLRNIAVVNGSVRNWGNEGIDLQTFGVLNCRVADLLASGNTGIGIITGGGSTVSNCSAYQNTADGIFAATGCTVTNCSAFLNTGEGFRTSVGCTISDCSAYDNGIGGIVVEDGSTVTNCSVYLNSWGITLFSGSTVIDCTTYSNTFDGIQCSSDCVIRGNTCVANGSSGGDGSGIHVYDSGNRIEGNNCTDADRGIDVDAAGNIIIKNTCSGNTTNWDIAANNVCGPILDRTAPASAAISGNSAPDSTGSTHPNANFTY